MIFPKQLSPQRRDKYLSLVRKRVLQAVRAPRASRPIFVFGKQRSGTSMLMYAFHRHPEVLVFDEHRDSIVFEDFQIRNFDIVKEVISQARFATVCFKPICDSHRISEFVSNFPDGRFIWIYREFQDVANSALRKFTAPTAAIRLVCEGRQGGGWFAEGVSPGVLRELMRVYDPSMSSFDLSCLVWWARNRIIIDSNLLTDRRVTIVNYEDLVGSPDARLRWLFRRIEVPYNARIGNRMTPRFVGRHTVPAMNESVRAMCQELTAQLNDAYQTGLRGGAPGD